VRLSVDPATISAPENVDIVQRDRMHEFERAVRMIIDAGMAVVIDIHPTSDFKMALERDTTASHASRISGTTWRAGSPHCRSNGSCWKS
jgi:hypothetical protein